MTCIHLGTALKVLDGNLMWHAGLTAPDTRRGAVLMTVSKDALAGEITELQCFVPTSHGRVWAHVCGPVGSSALPLVIVHGGPGFPSDYLQPLDVLADERHVLRYDQISTGRSEPASDDSAWTVEAHVEHLEQVRAHFGFSRFHLLGHSWGGFLALSYIQAHPSRVASVTLSSPLVDSDRWMRDATTLIARLPGVHQKSLAAGPADPGYAAAEAEYYRRHFCSIEPWPQSLQQAADGQDAASYHAMWGPNEFTNTGVLRGQSRAEVAKNLTIPNFWITGTDDEARPKTIREIASMNVNSEVLVLPGTHCVHLENPSSYESALRGFLHVADRD
ncbi:proline iminopeptidase [Actinomycetales bacterium SN12]|nr:proline iminopeptidase [Actinomycetales bacterium SN12]